MKGTLPLILFIIVIGLTGCAAEKSVPKPDTSSNSGITQTGNADNFVDAATPTDAELEQQALEKGITLEEIDVLKHLGKDYQEILQMSSDEIQTIVQKYKAGREAEMAILRIMTEERGLEDWQLTTLGNLGYGGKELLELTDEDIARICAPGAQLDGASFDPTEEQKKELSKLNIDVDMSVVLYNLGYEYDEMLKLTSEELDFIFPNTELVENLVKKGFEKDMVKSLRFLTENGWKSYKQVIEEALS